MAEKPKRTKRRYHNKLLLWYAFSPDWQITRREEGNAFTICFTGVNSKMLGPQAHMIYTTCPHPRDFPILHLGSNKRWSPTLETPCLYAIGVLKTSPPDKFLQQLSADLMTRCKFIISLLTMNFYGIALHTLFWWACFSFLFVLGCARPLPANIAYRFSWSNDRHLMNRQCLWCCTTRSLTRLIVDLTLLRERTPCL